MDKSEEIKARLQKANLRHWAGDNISDVLEDGDKEALIEEATTAFEKVLDALVIDRHNDPNSMGTGKRLGVYPEPYKNRQLAPSMHLPFVRIGFHSNSFRRDWL